MDATILILMILAGIFPILYVAVYIAAILLFEKKDNDALNEYFDALEQFRKGGGRN